MAGGMDRYKRFVPVVVEPEGRVHWEDEPVEVIATLRASRPDVEMRVQAWVTAWTPNAVRIFWWYPGMLDAHARWVSPSDIHRL